MASASPLPSLRRLSLIEQTTQALRDALTQGTLADPLPGEHHLARQLGVSRPTLRAAIEMLVRDGIIHRRKGQRSRLNRAQPPVAVPTPSVCVICPASRREIPPEEHPVLPHMQARFTTKGIGWDEVFAPKLAGPRPDKQLAQLTAGRNRTCWLLLASTEPMQRWFAQRGLNTLVLGTCHAGIALPAIDIDYRAVGWHAAGRILKSGHRQVALLEPEHPLAGDLACRDGFLAYCATIDPAPQVTSLKLSRQTQQVRIALTRLMARQPRPTAIFSLWQPNTLTALLHLLAAGIRVPQDVSLIARDLHPLIEQAWPDLAHYGRPIHALANRALRLTQAMLSGCKPPPRLTSITPEFIPGCTLGPLM